MKTNRKCPKWAEYNGGAPPTITPSGASPPQTPSLGGNLSFTKGPELPSLPMNAAGPPSAIRNQPSMFGYAAAVPSPLATSPPFTASDLIGDGSVSTPPPKLKLTLKKS